MKIRDSWKLMVRRSRIIPKPSDPLGTPFEIWFVLISISNVLYQLFTRSDNEFWILLTNFLSVRTNLVLCQKQSDRLIRFVKVRKLVGGSAEQLTYEAQARLWCLVLSIPTYKLSDKSAYLLISHLHHYSDLHFYLFGPTLVFGTLEYLYPTYTIIQTYIAIYFQSTYTFILFWEFFLPTWLIEPTRLFHFGKFSYPHVISNCRLIREMRVLISIATNLPKSKMHLNISAFFSGLCHSLSWHEKLPLASIAEHCKS